MNFQPNDYLQGLNLDFDSSIPSNDVSPNFNSTDLDIFSQSDFFALDVFSKDNIVPNKQHHGHVQSHPVQPQPVQVAPVVTIPEPRIAIKQEPQESSLNSTDGLDFLDFNPHQSPLKQETPSTNQTDTVIEESHHFVAELAANEDKRKRNTAASARFRIKKKLKEQEMEQKSKELQDKVLGLEKRLKTLEMENKCLKNLILQQNEQKNSDLLENIKKRSILYSQPVFQFTN
ncbi:hypothetical protein DFJ63DRAFT_314771 [Scheffersomyces coipomensis]|uniref:uncharacterized protein n=1 Tax=Scheffersomyces coipomensis TaxID=1788519 RepID=UPI00315D8A08